MENPFLRAFGSLFSDFKLTFWWLVESKLGLILLWFFIFILRFSTDIFLIDCFVQF